MLFYSKLAYMKHKIIIVACFPINESLTVLMVKKSSIFLHSNVVFSSMKYLKKTLKKLKYFMKYFKCKKKQVFLHL